MESEYIRVEYCEKNETPSEGMKAEVDNLVKDNTTLSGCWSRIYVVTENKKHEAGAWNIMKLALNAIFEAISTTE